MSMSTARRRSSPVYFLRSLGLCRLMPFNWLILWIILIPETHSMELQKLSNTTYLLDTLLSEDKYDRKIRPGLGGPPTVITTEIEIRSFGPISESEMVYSMDCYFRQKWNDIRLQFHSHQDQLSMDWKFLEKVWIPDTFFLNGKSSYLHKVTVPNKFIRLHKDGQLTYSMRLTIKASCPMHLRKYPLDTQACPLEIGSYAYPDEDVVYKWINKERPVDLSNDVILSQYDFVNITTTNRIHLVKIGDRTDQRSILVVYFIIQRRRGYFILQIYAPCAMIVGASWVSFWINRSDAAGRVAVGATTVLTMVTMGFGGRGREKVGSATAIDWFVIMCFTFVFSALVEYAFVNFIDNYEKRQAKKQMEIDKEKKKKEQTIGFIAEPAVLEENAEGFAKIGLQNAQEKGNHIEKKASSDKMRQKEKELENLIQVQPFAFKQRRPFFKGRLSLGKRAYRNRHIASKVDSYARICFPVTFVILNVMYWALFLLIMDDEISLTTHAGSYV